MVVEHNVPPLAKKHKERKAKALRQLGMMLKETERAKEKGWFQMKPHLISRKYLGDIISANIIPRSRLFFSDYFLFPAWGRWQKSCTAVGQKRYCSKVAFLGLSERV